MSLSDRWPVVAALVAAAVLSVATPGAGATWAGAAQPQTKAVQAGTAPGRAVVAERRGRPSAATTVARAGNGRSAPVTVLLVGLGAVVGITVGLIPAVVVAMLLGVVPDRPRRRPRSEDLLVEPPRAPRAPPHPGPMALAAAPDLAPDESRPRPRPAVARTVASGPPPEIAERRARHRALYDAEYAKQLEHLAAQREAISTDVAVPIELRPARSANGRRTGGPSSHD
jgi:hypothetical protein